MGIFSTASRAAALLACATMIATPAMATRTVPVAIPLSARPAPLPAWTPADDTAAKHRWRRHRGHRGGIDVGDILTGVLIIGGIAAVGSAIDKDQEKRSRDRTQGRDYPYRDAPGDYRSGERDERDYDREGSGPRYDAREADRAVDSCAVEAERSGRVDEIIDVDKVGGEWRVRGDYDDGREFTCTFDRNGRAYVGLDDRADSGSWDARGDEVEADPVARAADPRDADEDDRYATSNAPDFEDPRGF